MLNTSNDPLIGSTVSQYTIVAKLGGGGMGVVYKATDTKLGRTVALKFLPPQWSYDEAAKQRFRREAQAASATNHRNICVIHDIEETPDGRLFIVMAYYEGQTLKERLEHGALPLYDALEIAGGVAEGLAKAHGQGVVHRDIKPGNLILSEDGVRIVDFGLATFADAVKLTIEGSTIGTVAYMSPEQARGEEADARSDVWALGVVLYEMLTGEVPFKGTYPEAVFYAIKNEPLPPMKLAAGPETERLQALVQRALEKDPDKRYQSARDVARDLRLLRGVTVPVDLLTGPVPSPKGPPPDRRSVWQRFRDAVTPVRAAAVLLVVAIAAGGTYRWLTRPVVRIPIAIAPVANHTGEPELDQYRLALTQLLTDELVDSTNLRVLPYMRLVEILSPFSSRRADISSRDVVQTIATASGARFVVLPTIVRRADAWLLELQLRDVEAGLDIATYNTEAITSVLPKDSAHRLVPVAALKIQSHFGPGGALGSLLTMLRVKPDTSQRIHDFVFRPKPARRGLRTLDAAYAFERGLRAYEQLEYAAALEGFREAAASDSQHAATQAWLSRVFLIMSQGNDAATAGQRAKQLIAPDTPQADATFVAAVAAESQSDVDAAARLYAESVVRRPDDAAALLQLADFFKRQNRDAEAISAYREVLRLYSAFIRPHVDLCQLYARTDEYPLADEEARTAVSGYRTAANQAGEAQALLALSELRRRQRKLDEAEQAAQAARSIFESLGLDYGLSRVHQYLGTIAGNKRDYRSAVLFFEEARTRSRRVGNRQLEALVLMNLGFSHEALGQIRQSLEYYQQSRPLFAQIGDEGRAAELDVSVANLMVTYGTGLTEVEGRLASARATLQRLHRVNFDVIAMQVQAERELYAGHHKEARRQLGVALSQATDRHLDDQIASSTNDLAKSHFMLNEYEDARSLFDRVVAGPDGPQALTARIGLGSVNTRLGDFESARRHLESALGQVERTGQAGLVSEALESLGELAYESGRLPAALDYFHRSMNLWTDDLPNASSVQASCYLGLLDARVGGSTRARIEQSVKRAQEMGRLDLEGRCRLGLANVQVAEGRYQQALATLDGFRVDADRAVGPELRAEMHEARSRALARQRDPSAPAQGIEAQKLLEGLKNSLPESSRPSFLQRATVRRVLETQAVP